MIKEGVETPNFVLKNDGDEEISLSSFQGKKVVLYFYPKDDTSGCTAEACSFRDVYDDILETGAVVLGVSGDSVKSHGNFKKKYNLPFHLLSDPERKVIEAYGALGEKKMYGKTYLGILRSTFIIDEKGRVAKVFPKVKPSEHAKEVLESLKA
jgi:peroxiredoxin Q/BCP